MTKHDDIENGDRSIADIEQRIAMWLASEADAKAALRAQGIAETWSAQLLAERLRQATLTPDTLADALGTSEHALRECIARLGGKFRLGEMILLGRLELAAKLLANRLASTSIIDIAQACGWDDPRRFAVVFKALWGVTPKEFQTAIAKGKAVPTKAPRPNGQLPTDLSEKDKS